ncbi:MAG: MFS transporter [Thermoflexibacter sp.]|jgi:MFS family permease|nr:MFS transporter [Thermoflexibacter sp.]
MSYQTNRIAVSAMFFVNGIIFASWASRIPLIQHTLKINHAELGGVLLALPLGSLVTLPIVGWLTTRFKSRHLVVFSVLLLSFILTLIPLAPNPLILSVILFFFGFASDLLNISMNTQAVALEVKYHKPIMSSFHALFSLGGMFGAGIGGIMEQLQISLFTHFLSIGLIFGIVAALFKKNLLKEDITSDEKHPLFAKPDSILLGLGIIAFCVMIGEGAMADWSAVYLKESIQDSSGLSTAGYTAFSLAMASGRFAGDWLTARFGTIKLLKINGTLACLGMLLALFFPYTLPIILGFTLVGLGLSTGVPLVYSLAGRSKTMPAGVALAAVTTVGATGFLIGPPIIGFLAELSTLRIALALIAILSAMIVVLAQRARAN